MERPPFEPRRLDPCFCDSGRRFKNCCGSRAPERPPPHAVVRVPGFLPAEECARLVRWADRQTGEAMTVVDHKTAGAEGLEGQPSTLRASEEVALGDELYTLNDWIRRAIRSHIAPALQRTVAWFEAPALMRYREGGRFARHADAEYWDAGRRAWVRNLDRDISLLLYLNEDFEGGALRFPVFHWLYAPKAGDLLFFPSDARYQHEALPVTAGRRYAVVSWMALEGAPRVQDETPVCAVRP